MAYKIVMKKSEEGLVAATISHYLVEGKTKPQVVAEFKLTKVAGRITLDPPMTAEEYNPPKNFLHRILKAMRGFG